MCVCVCARAGGMEAEGLLVPAALYSGARSSVFWCLQHCTVFYGAVRRITCWWGGEARATGAPSTVLYCLVLSCTQEHVLVGWRGYCKLQALVYDILPSTTAVFSYAMGFGKLSANEQFFVGAQTVVSLLQTTQIKQGVSFTAANKVYTSANKATIV